MHKVTHSTILRTSYVISHAKVVVIIKLIGYPDRSRLFHAHNQEELKITSTLIY